MSLFSRKEKLSLPLQAQVICVSPSEQRTNLSSLFQNKATFRNNSFMKDVTKGCAVENYKTKERQLITWQGDVHDDKTACDDRTSVLQQRTCLHLQDRRSLIERPWISHREKPQTHDTHPTVLSQLIRRDAKCRPLLS